MWNREIVRAMVVGMLLVVGLGGVVSGQEEDPDRVRAEEILKALIEEGGTSDQVDLKERFVAALREEFGSEHSLSLAAMANLAVELYRQEDYSGAQTLEEEVLAVRQRVLGREHADTLAAMSRLAGIVFKQGDSDRGLELREEILATHRRVHGPEDPATLKAMVRLAATLYNEGDYSRAQELEEEVLEVRSRVLGVDHPDTLTAMESLSATLRAQGELSSARQLLEEALEIRRRTLGADHPDTLAATQQLARTLWREGDRDEAQELEEKILAARQRQDPEDPATLKAMADLAVTRFNQGDYSGARELEEAVLAIRRRVLGADHLDTLAAMDTLGTTLRAQGLAAQARVLIEEALEIRRRVLGVDHPDSLTSMANLASTLNSQGDFSRARELEEEVLSTRRRVLGADHPHTLTSMGNLASTLNSQGDFSRARELEEEVLSTRRRVLGADHPDTLTSMANLASTLYEQGDFSRAREILEEVLSTRRRVLGADHPDTLTSMGNLATTLRSQGYFSRARELEEEVFSTRRRVLGADHPSTLISMGNLATTLKAQGDHSRAHKIEEEVLSRSRRVLGTDHPSTLTSMNNFARALHEQGELSQARELEEELLSTRRRVLGADHPDTLMSMMNLAGTLKAQGDHHRARKMEEKVLSIRRRILGPDHPSTLRTQNNLALSLYRLNDVDGARRLLEELITVRASAVGADYRAGTLAEIHTIHSLSAIYAELGLPEKANQYLQQALDAVETQTARSGDTEDFKSGFKAQFENIYRDALTTLLDIGQLTEAHLVLERFRAQGFLTMITERDIVLSGIPFELEERRRKLAAKYDATIQARDKLYAREHRAKLLVVLERQREIRRERERLAAEIRRQAPGVAALQDPKPLTVEDIRQALEPGTLMLSYFVGPRETFLFTLSRQHEIEFHRFKISEKTLWKQSREYFGQIQGAVSEELEASRQEMGRWLYDKLVAPAASRIEESDRLLVIADGPLHYLPFSALIRTTEANDRKWQYLIEWKPVHSVLSATVYAQLQKWRPKPSQGDIELQVAAFGNPSYPSDDAKGHGNAVVRSAIERGIFDGLDPLPYTEHEVNEIERLFPEDSAQVFLGADATEENAKALGKKVRIAHFAAHGVTDPFTQLDSFIALSILDDQDENGLLQAWEIYERVRLDADLVVLSACQTAFGPETDGEGLMSLSRAFQYAGARTVMASLWSVNDQSTAELMIRFYRHLQDGKSKDEALQAAQIEFIQGPIEVEENGVMVEKNYTSPFHWAAFQVIGDWQ